MDYQNVCSFLKASSSSSCRVFSIGKSVLGKDILAANVYANSSAPWAIVTGGMHAREHLSTDLVCMQIAELATANNCGVNICFVPQVNPDGADLCLHGTQDLPNDVSKSLIEINNGSDFSLWKANINGVDLNNNFDANWRTKFGGKTSSASGGYYGSHPFSEPESAALASLTKTLCPFITISYHLKGEEIYFDFFQSCAAYCRDKRIAEIFASSTGYKIVSTQGVSSGGYKDWCVQKLGIPALTIELGADRFSHPFPHHQLSQIYSKNKDLSSCLAKAYKIVQSVPAATCLWSASKNYIV